MNQKENDQIVKLLHLPDKLNESDFLAICSEEAKAKLLEEIKNTPLVTPEQLNGRGGKTESQELKILSVKDLYDTPFAEERWLVDKQLSVGGISLIAGKPGIGKSVIVRNLGLAVCRGSQWFGYQAHQGTVLYVSLDESMRSFREHLKRMGVTPADPFYSIIQQPPASAMTQLTRIARVKRPSLIVIDTLQTLIQTENLNDYSETTKRMIPLKRIAEETGAHLMLLHHAEKGAVFNAQDAVLGSSAIAASADIVYLLRESGGFKTLQTTKIRGIGSVEHIPETVVGFSRETGLIWRGSLKRDAKSTRIESAIIEFLMRKKESQPKSEIKKNVKGRNEIIDQALKKLVKEGRVETLGKGISGDPYLYQLPGGSV